jgi:hypothetical protein
MVYTDVNYNEEFVLCLIRDVEKKLALVSNKDYKNIVYGLNLKSSIFQYKDLVHIIRILNRILECNSCYQDFEIEDIVSMVKNELRNC